VVFSSIRQVKPLLQMLVALGDDDAVPSDPEEMQGKLDQLIENMDASGDGTITWPEMWDAIVEMILGDPEADPEDMKALFDERVTSKDMADWIIKKVQDLNLFDQ
jgi:hypothetical protein